MILLSTKTAITSPLSTREKLALYNGMDTMSLFEINDQLSSFLTPAQKQMYEWEIDLNHVLLSLEFRGCLVDDSERRVLISEYKTQQTYWEKILHRFASAVGYYNYYLTHAVLRFAEASGEHPDDLPRSWDEWKFLPLSTRRELKRAAPKALPEYHKALKTFGTPEPFNPNSSAQSLRLFYDFFGHEGNSVSKEISPDFPPPYNKTRGISEIKGRKADNTWGPTADRGAMEKIISLAHSSDPRDAAFWAAPFAKVALILADIQKTLGFLECKLESGYFRASFGAVTETGRLNSSKNAMGFGSNFQNITPKNRRIFVAEPGYKLGALDLEQAESRSVGAICYQLFGAHAYLDACESGDLHTLVCAMVWQDLPWPEEFNLDTVRKYGQLPKELIKAAKKIANQKFYRDFSYRDMSKRLGHGSNYFGKPVHMAKQTHIELALVQRFQSAYFAAFAELPQWHQWVITQLQTTGVITTFLGRTRRFFGRPNDEATWREAIAFEPQSVATGDYTNRALIPCVKEQYKLRKELGYFPYEMFLQKHDELGFAYLESHEDLAISTVKENMEQHITLTDPAGNTRDWYIPTDILTGWNLGYASDKNPDGLAPLSVERTRKRLPNQFLNMRF